MNIFFNFLISTQENHLHIWNTEGSRNTKVKRLYIEKGFIANESKIYHWETEKETVETSSNISEDFTKSLGNCR